jgi:hypothetical protein
VLAFKVAHQLAHQPGFAGHEVSQEMGVSETHRTRNPPLAARLPQHIAHTEVHKGMFDD